MTNVNHIMGVTEWLLLLILSVLWGGSFFFVGVAVKALPPFTIVALRVGLAAIVLNLVVRATGVRMPTDRRLWGAFFGMAFLNNMIPFCLIVWGQTHIASGLASILNSTTPLFTVIVAHAFTKDEKSLVYDWSASLSVFSVFLGERHSLIIMVADDPEGGLAMQRI